MAKSDGGSTTGVAILGFIALALVIAYWYVVVAVAALAGVAFLVSVGWEAHGKRKALRARERAAICARADYEHQQFLNGDPRGLYGQYQPPQL